MTTPIIGKSYIVIPPNTTDTQAFLLLQAIKQVDLDMINVLVDGDVYNDRLQNDVEFQGDIYKTILEVVKQTEMMPQDERTEVGAAIMAIVSKLVSKGLRSSNPDHIKMFQGALKKKGSPLRILPQRIKPQPPASKTPEERFIQYMNTLDFKHLGETKLLLYQLEDTAFITQIYKTFIALAKREKDGAKLIQLIDLLADKRVSFEDVLITPEERRRFLFTFASLGTPRLQALAPSEKLFTIDSPDSPYFNLFHLFERVSFQNGQIKAPRNMTGVNKDAPFYQERLAGLEMKTPHFKAYIGFLNALITDWQNFKLDLSQECVEKRFQTLEDSLKSRKEETPPPIVTQIPKKPMVEERIPAAPKVYVSKSQPKEPKWKPKEKVQALKPAPKKAAPPSTKAEKAPVAKPGKQEKKEKDPSISDEVVIVRNGPLKGFQPTFTVPEKGDARFLEIKEAILEMSSLINNDSPLSHYALLYNLFRAHNALNNFSLYITPGAVWEIRNSLAHRFQKLINGDPEMVRSWAASLVKPLSPLVKLNPGEKIEIEQIKLPKDIQELLNSPLIKQESYPETKKLFYSLVKKVQEIYNFWQHHPKELCPSDVPGGVASVKMLTLFAGELIKFNPELKNTFGTSIPELRNILAHEWDEEAASSERYFLPEKVSELKLELVCKRILSHLKP